MDDPVLRVQSQLTARDRVLLGWLYDHGVLTSFQIAHALFPSLDFCQRRLLTLYRLRLVGRFRPQRADGGSYPYHYVIDQLGAEVVAAGRDERPPRRDHARVERRRWTSSRTLEHRLGVNGFFTDLAGYARTHADVGLGEWLSEAACQRSAVFTRAEDPALVRAYQPRVRPDGYGLWTVRGVGVPFFVEYDTGGEQLSVLTRKLLGYRDWFAALGRVWPVLFWLHSAARERNLRRLLAETPPLVPVATGARDHATTAGLCPAQAVWSVAGGDGQRSTLADLAVWVADARDLAGEAAA
ncbi:replication-relaxation family protein [Micromonospora sp. NPDC047134]|uniref:replication-relaxation family protein n=1 Tax=Micromonospora sp. NPDC047134 TaxID=3154340 RepID=UPI00340FEB61